MTRSPPRRGRRAGGDSDSRRPSPSPRAELCDMILECNQALIPNVGINRWLLLGSTVDFCWDRPSALAGIDRKLQGELCKWKLYKEVWWCGTMHLFDVSRCYLKEQIQELLANKRN
jgi:hypothetical protein